MARKEINVFNVSFIDLLSGALGAVLILFVIIPKLDGQMREQLQELETFKELKLDVTEIQSMINSLDGKVDKSVVSNLQSKVNLVETDITKLQEQVEALQTQLAKSENEKQKVQVQNQELDKQLETLREQVKNSTNLSADNSKLQNELSSTKQVRDDLQKQIENLRLQQKDAGAASVQINEQLEEQQGAIAKCLEDKKALEDAISELRAKIEQLAAENADLAKTVKTTSNDKEFVKDAVDKMADELARLKKVNTDLKTENEQVQKKNGRLDKKLRETEVELAEAQKKTPVKEPTGTKIDRTGLDLNGKKNVFVVDVSGSMDDNPEPEKLDQVKAGLKMLVASMDDTYNIDIVIFPKSPTQDWDALYNRLVKVTDDQKYAIYRHLSPIYARNCTPTRSVLEHVLTDPAYKDAGTITFLSDGLPTKSIAGSSECPEDPYKEVLAFIKGLNKGKRIINTIGVGEVYRKKNSKDSKVVFMRRMAEENGGFYIGF